MVEANSGGEPIDSQAQSKAKIPEYMLSSKKSPGIIGVLNRFLASCFGQEDADFKAFLYWMSGRDSQRDV